jgi:hypothetical protein
MGERSTYQAVLGMVLGLTILSLVSQQPYTTYAGLIIGFMALLRESWGGKLVTVVHHILNLAFLTLLKLLLLILYLGLMSPIAFIKGRKRPGMGWQSKDEKPSKMEYTW